MGADTQYGKFLEVLRGLGLHTWDGVLFEGEPGFPCVVPLRDGGQIALELPSPGLLANLDPTQVGVAVLDASGYPTAGWGLAATCAPLAPNACAFETELGTMLRAAQTGVPGAVYIDGNRYYACALGIGPRHSILVLVTHAGEEREYRSRSERYRHLAHVFRRVGRALTITQSVEPLCHGAVHEIAAASDLVAALLWVVRDDPSTLELVASMGINREASTVLRFLSAQDGVGCVAELVASTRQSVALRSVHDNVMTSSLEAKICYLAPGPVSILPLAVGDELVGVVELIAAEGDRDFLEHSEMFEAVAEHLALAINNAKMFEQVERLATSDPLTGLANHRTLREFLANRALEANRLGQEIGVIMIDVDHFRTFNEEEGHQAGDLVLRRVAETIRTCLRPYDLAARYGGEEFTIVLVGSNLASSAHIAQRIRERVAAVQVRVPSGKERSVTISLGVAVYPSASQDVVELLRCADRALYEAKRSGRNRVVEYDPSAPWTRATPRFEAEEIWRSVDAHLVDETKALVESVAPMMERVAHRIRLSEQQVEAMRWALTLWPSYRAARERANGAPLAWAEETLELRAALNVLEWIDERFDGAGVHGLAGASIPLLTRVLAVLLAGHRDPGGWRDDPGRFDPELVSVAQDVADAA